MTSRYRSMASGRTSLATTIIWWAAFSASGRLFPNFWRYILVRTAANLAAAFHAAHQAGVVIGDVNHGSVRVGDNGCVRLIDCDSFQVTHEARSIVRSRVGSWQLSPRAT
jgi:DNA-binding helix-hairpin-helix protein with protein kinase domain